VRFGVGLGGAFFLLSLLDENEERERFGNPPGCFLGLAIVGCGSLSRENSSERFAVRRFEKR
jgi:hypothetical protein